jgi:hypothetical protein
LAETWGRQRFLGGESYAFEYLEPPDEDDTMPEQPEWLCLSPLEMRRRDDGTVELLGRPKSEQTTYTKIPPGEPLQAGECHLYRLWRSHPRNSYQVDATMRAVLSDCERLKMIRAKDISETRSRIPAGILTYPKRSFPPSPGDEPGQLPKSLRDLQESLVRPIKDPGDASAQVPFMVGVDGAAADKPQELFRHLTLNRSDSEAGDADKEERSVVAIARGLDMPVEYLTGVGAINHWGQWFIEDQLWKSHLQPLAAEFCREWTEGYLLPLTEDESLTIWYDETDIVAQPDKGKDAKDLFPLGAMTWDELRTANGFKPDDGPDEAQRGEIAAWYTAIKGQPVGIAPASDGTSGSVDQSPPGTNGQTASGDGLAAYRAREVAGNRLVNLIRKTDPQLLIKIQALPRCDVARYVGHDNAVRLTGSQTPELVLLDGAGETYQQWLVRQGYPVNTATMQATQMLAEVAAGLFDDHHD